MGKEAPELLATHEDRSRCCFREWMELQRQDLTHLQQSLHNHDHIQYSINNCIAHFHDYISTRTRIAQENASPFFAPTWCSSLENSLLWIAGCRPSIFVRLLYALTGCDVDARLSEWLESGIMNNNNNNNNDSGPVGFLSPTQMARVNALHIRTIREEEKLTSQMASSQEDLADHPIAVVANEMEAVGEVNETAEAALTKHEKVMREIMGTADEFRLNTLKEVIEILEPKQAVEYLIATKKLQLSLHQWGKLRDDRHGRTS